MNISLIKSRIEELRKLANNTDSKKEDLEYRREIKRLIRQLEDYTDELINKVPETIKLRIKVDKIITYDTDNFKSYLYDYIGDSANYDINIDEELMEYIKDYMYIDDYLDFDDYDIKVDKKC